MDDLHGKRVLLVEDDPLLYSLLLNNMKGLSADGLEIDTAVDGQEALSKARAHQPDLILLDLILPTMSGFDVLEEIRAEHALAATPVVLITNLNTEADRKHARALGVIAYIVKSDATLKEISAAVKSFLLGEPMRLATSETERSGASHTNIVRL